MNFQMSIPSGKTIFGFVSSEFTIFCYFVLKHAKGGTIKKLIITKKQFLNCDTIQSIFNHGKQEKTVEKDPFFFHTLSYLTVFHNRKSASLEKRIL